MKPRYFNLLWFLGCRIQPFRSENFSHVDLGTQVVQTENDTQTFMIVRFKLVSNQINLVSRAWWLSSCLPWKLANCRASTLRHCLTCCLLYHLERYRTIDLSIDIEL